MSSNLTFSANKRKKVAPRLQKKVSGRRLFYTIGHSTRPIGEFLRILKDLGVTCVVDVRTVPRSRANPQYDQKNFARALHRAHLRYEHMAALGGLRPRSREVSPCVNAFWQNQSFHNYADYALGVSFRVGLKSLRALGKKERCVVTCAEALWWRCHRRIIADYLLVTHERVLHILGSGHTERAALTAAAQKQRGPRLKYPAPK